MACATAKTTNSLMDDLSEGLDEGQKVNRA